MSFVEETPIKLLRRSIGKPLGSGKSNTPKRLSHKPDLQTSLTFAHVPQNDDELEKKQRRREKLEQLHRDNLNSPLTPVERRRSLKVNTAGLTNAQLTEHYANCMKLSAENKITAKNAFGLHLIDFMNEIVKNKDGETNFQMASCTLDAGAKIYAYRVDCVYANTFKIASGLGIAEDSKKNGEVENNVDSEDRENKSDKKRKVKKSSTIEQNLSSLNLKKFDARFQVDPLLIKMSGEFDTAGLNGFLFNTFPIDDGNEQIIDSRNIHSFCAENKENTYTDVGKFKDMFKQLLADEVLIDPQLSNLSFLNFDHSIVGQVSESHNDIFSPPDKRSKCFPENTFSEQNLVDDYNDDVEIENLFNSSNEDGVLELKNCNDEVREKVFGANRLIKGDIESMTSSKSRLKISDMVSILADQPSEYSYFNSDLLSAWAGPKHWKLLPSNKVKKKELTSELGDSSRRRVLKVFKINYDEDKNLDVCFSNSKSITLSKKTMENWNSEKTTLPEDLHYNAENLMKLFLKPTITVKRKKCPLEINDENNSYNYDNPNDCENYCPNVKDESSDNEYEETRFPNVNFTCFEASQDHDVSPDFIVDQTGGLGNLVEQPNKINRINIQYARTAKKIDVKRLKKHMWNILIRTDDENKESVETEISNQKVNNKIEFTKLCDTLLSCVSTSMADNLSVPIAFVSLLHLVNEQNLTIDGLSDFSNFIISQG